MFHFLTSFKLGKILDHAYRILIIANFGSGKSNILLNLTKEQDHDDNSIIDEIYFKTLMLKPWKIQRLLLNIQIISKISIKKWRVEPKQKTLY